MGTMVRIEKHFNEMSNYEKIKEAFCYCTDKFGQSALKCMAQGTVPYDEDFVRKWIPKERGLSLEN